MSKAERTKKYIVEQTAPVFNRKGFSGTSMSDLISATGLSKGAIYGNFKSKDEVALAAFDYNMGQIFETISGMMSVHTSPLEKLKVFPAFYREIFKRKYFKLGCPIVNTAPEADDTHDQMKAKVNGVISKWDDTITKLVEEGKERNEIKPSTDAAQIAAILITQIEGGIMIAKSTGDLRYMNMALDQIDQLIEEISI